MIIRKNLALFIMLNAIFITNNMNGMQRVKKIARKCATVTGAFTAAGLNVVIQKEMRRQNREIETNNTIKNPQKVLKH